MSSTTPLIDQIDFSQTQKEVIVNRVNNAESPAALFGINTVVGLTLSYYGGVFNVASVPTVIASGTIALTASTTNYIYATSSGVVTQTTSIPGSWPGPLASGAVALYSMVTGASTLTSHIDYRTGVASGAASSGAPTTASYVTLGTDATLTNERVLTAGSGISLVDAGAGSTLTISTAAGGPTAFMYGDGLDGAFVFDGTNTYAGSNVSKSGNTYTLGRSLAATSISISGPVTVVTSNFALLCQGDLANAGIIHNDGLAATSSTGALAVIVSGPYNTNNAPDGAAGAQTTAPGASTSVANAIGGAGGNGGSSPAGAGGSAGTLTAPTAAQGGLVSACMSDAWCRMKNFQNSIYNTSSGGGGGRGEAGTAGGGGGAGATAMFIASKTISGSGTLRCNGGAGATIGSGTNIGGGGGGGGGRIWLITGSPSHSWTIQVSGGAGGAGRGTGSAGSSGSAGYATVYLGA